MDQTEVCSGEKACWCSPGCYSVNCCFPRLHKYHYFSGETPRAMWSCPTSQEIKRRCFCEIHQENQKASSLSLSLSQGKKRVKMLEEQVILVVKERGAAVARLSQIRCCVLHHERCAACASVCSSSLCAPEERTARNFHFKRSWISLRLKPLPPSNQMGPWGDWRVKGMWRSPLCKRLYFDSSGEEICVNMLVAGNAHTLFTEEVGLLSHRAEQISFFILSAIKKISV